MRLSVLSSLALALAGASHGMDFSTPGDLEASRWEGPVASIESRDHASNRPAKRQSGWNPPANLALPLREAWDHVVRTYNGGNFFGFRNYMWDQLFAPNSGGVINLCVRWESDVPVTEANRRDILAAARRTYGKWFTWVIGYDNFPYSNVPINIVGWAVRDRNLIQWSTAGIDIYTDRDVDGVPQCAPACGRFFNQNGDYSRCPGGAPRRYDHSLWLSDGWSGGHGGDWGQRMGRDYFMRNLNTENILIYLHEVGHTFGLDDFYDWHPTGMGPFMMSALVPQLTDFDGWMLRNWWYELSRNRGWRSGSPPTPQPPTTTSTPPVPTNNPPTPPTGETVPKWGQCGGQGWTGPTRCEAGSTCVAANQWYSQCV